jgi:hypothetical protein
MTFDDPDLQRHFDRVATLMTSLPEEIRPIFALIDAYTWFRLIEGEQSPRLQDILQRLIAPELRPALRRWYAGFGGDMNPGAMEFHDFLERTIGEGLPLGNSGSLA